ncbi:MAG: DUF5916 domain-containing protein [Gemmatimonadetes bacterium]|nr:DUF5916 domain-containing protein [Gemmatimonadota bacterium]
MILRYIGLSAARGGLVLAALALVFTAEARGQASPKTARATRIEGDRPVINGRMDEAVWETAEVISSFVQRSPDEGAQPLQQTRVYILYDDEALYIGARMASDDPSAIAAPVTRRDGFSNAERLTISLDPYLDRRTAYSFSVTSGGVRSDQYHANDNEHRAQSQYNPVWHAVARVDSAGWTAEMKIPYSQIRFTRAEEQVWGMNLRRWTPTLNASDYWVMVPSSETGFASRFGTLEGLKNVLPPRRVELLPYVAGEATAANRAQDDPFRTVLGNRFGGDAKLGIGSNLTLDLTVNPDFGQVEADPAEVNLTQFETFFDERRPFFIEGNELLTGQGPDYYYSRRIGARPHGNASGDFVDRPNNTTIAGAAKLTGRLASGLSVGALASVTPRELARTFDRSSDTVEFVSVEAPTGFGVIRLQQELGRSQSTVGATLTGVHRGFGERDGELGGLLHRNAYSGGADWRLRFKDGEYELTGYAGFSHVRGDAAALERTQRSSAHYFQRPDADYVTLDPTRTSLSGYALSIRGDKNAGRHILWGAQMSARSPGFEINDLGRLNSADAVDFNADIQIRDTQPGKLFRNYRIGTSIRGGWNFGGVRQSTVLQNNTRVTFHNFWDLTLRTTRTLRAQSDFLTRGGPSMGTGSGWGFNARVSNGYSAATRMRVSGDYKNGELGGWSYTFGGGITLRPIPAWQLSIDPSYTRSVNPRQYIGTYDNGRDVTFGNRYIFGFIERSRISAKIRMDYAFTPNLTVEAYAEPFASSGRYFDHGELEAPRSRDLITYGTQGTTIVEEEDGSYSVTDGAETFSIPNRDFNVLSFRSNLVVRWEWLPGSTFFLVWQQSRSAEDQTGEIVGADSLRDALRAPGLNFFAAKLTYWFSVH